MLRLTANCRLAFVVMVAVVLHVAIVGCSKVTKSNIDKVQKGMAEAEVESILGVGSPTIRDTTPADMQEVTWENGTDKIMVQFKDGRVEGIMKSHTE